MRSRTLTGLIAAGILAAVPAMASDEPDHRYVDTDDYDYADVLDVDPIYRDVHVSVPRRECRTDVYEVPAGFTYRGGERLSAGPMIMGGLIGAVIGRGAAGEVNESPRVQEREVCGTRYEERTEREIEGYRVSYRYNGHDYTTRMPYEPGERIRVHVTVDPVGA